MFGSSGTFCCPPTRSMPAAIALTLCWLGYGRRVPLIFTTGSKPVARVTPRLTDKSTLLGDLVGTTLITTPFGIHIQKM